MAQLSIEEAADAIAGSMTDWSSGGMRAGWPNQLHRTLAERYVSASSEAEKIIEDASQEANDHIVQGLVTTMTLLGTRDDPKNFEAYAQSMIRSLRQAEKHKAE